jgi:hypothetical protein
MAAALAAMDQSPDRDLIIKSVVSERVVIDRTDGSRIVEKQEGQLENSDSEVGPRKKAVKVCGKGNLKKKLTLNKDIEGKVNEMTETKMSPEKPVTPPGPEKKTSVKSPTRKHSTDVPQLPSATPPLTPTNTEASKVDGRKNYPKRENRKPPAHLAEALGPALFSTPDIIRRVSTGNEQKTATPPEILTAETRKDANSPSAPSDVSGVNVSELTQTPSAQEEGMFIFCFLFLYYFQFERCSFVFAVKVRLVWCSISWNLFDQIELMCCFCGYSLHLSKKGIFLPVDVLDISFFFKGGESVTGNNFDNMI